MENQIEQKQNDPEKERLKEENRKLQSDLRESLGLISSLKDESVPLTGPGALINGANLALDTIDVQRIVFLIEKGKKLVKDMTAEEKFILRQRMDLAQKTIRCIAHGVAIDIIEAEEKANEEERKALKELDKKYPLKKKVESKPRDLTSHPFDSLVKQLIDMGMSPEAAANQATAMVLEGRAERKEK